jgi:hypothetical protein
MLGSSLLWLIFCTCPVNRPLGSDVLRHNRGCSLDLLGRRVLALLVEECVAVNLQAGLVH